MKLHPFPSGRSPQTTFHFLLLHPISQLWKIHQTQPIRISGSWSKCQASHSERMQYYACYSWNIDKIFKTLFVFERFPVFPWKRTLCVFIRCCQTFVNCLGTVDLQFFLLPTPSIIIRGCRAQGNDTMLSLSSYLPVQWTQKWRSLWQLWLFNLAAKAFFPPLKGFVVHSHNSHNCLDNS